KEAEKHLPGQSGEVADWVKEMVDSGIHSFYTTKEGKRYYYDIKAKEYKIIPGQEDVIRLSTLQDEHTLWENSGVRIIDLGEGVINCEFHTKMNTIGGDVIQGIHKAIDLAEEKYKALVISN